jgi:hypothetical protein
MQKDNLKNENPTDANNVLPAVFSRQEKLEIWLNKRIEKAKEEGKELFMGVPDEWYENPLHCCNNGHINGMYLKSSEKGAVCLTCHEPSHIFPSDATQEELNVALS